MIGDTQTSRDALLALLRREPGLHLREIPRRLGLSLSSVRYHLASLVNSESVIQVHHGRFVRWFPRQGLAAEDFLLISALRIHRQRAILLDLLERGPSRFSEIRSATGIPPSALVSDLRRLRSQGLLVVGDGPRYAIADPPSVRRQLQRYRVVFPDLLADGARSIFEL